MMQALILSSSDLPFARATPGRLSEFHGAYNFSALAVATNFTAVLVIAAEALWLIYLSFRCRGDARSARGRLYAVAAGCGPDVGVSFCCCLLRRPALGSKAWVEATTARSEPPGTMGAFGNVRECARSFRFRVRAVRHRRVEFGMWRLNRDQAVLLILWIALPPVVLFAGSTWSFRCW